MGIARLIRHTEKEMKKIISFALCIVMIISAVNLNFFKISAASTVDVNKLVSLAKKFPNGKYWNHVGLDKNNPDGYTNTPCAHHGSACQIKENACECNFFNNAIQCAGYAYKISSEIVGTSFSTWKKSTEKLDASKLYVGDIIRYLKTPSTVGHSVTVVGISGNTIAYTGANWGANCQIRWSSATVDKFVNFDYVLHDPNNKIKSSNITFFEGVTAEEPQKTETWRMKSDANLNVRETPSTSGTLKGRITAGSEFFVTEKKDDGTYLWGKVSNGSFSGWAVLNYATYLSGEYQAVKFEKFASALSQTSYTVRWTPLSGAKTYDLEIYNSKSEKIKTVTTSKTSADYVFPTAGKYYLKVIAKNSFAPSWKVSSSKTALNVAQKPTKMQSVSLAQKLSVTLGSSLTANAKVTPENTTDKLVWKSNNTKIATVDQNGKITAVKSGDVVIECYSDGDKTVTAKTTVSVRPSTVKNFAQNLSSTLEKSVSLKWDKLSGANGYRVYRTTSAGNLKLLAETDQTSFTEKGLGYTRGYSYSIRAYQTVDGKKYFGAYTEVETVTAPPKVTGLKLSKVSDKTFELKWDKTALATSYAVYRLDSSTGKYTKLKTVTGNSAEISGTSGTVYSFKVCSVFSTDGKSKESALSSAVKGYVKLGAVKGISQDFDSSSSQSVKLNWKKTAGANGYRIYRITSTGKTKFLLQTDKNYFEEENLAFANTYTYLIKACQSVDGKTHYGPIARFTAVTSPEQPQNLKVAKITETSYELRWDKSPGSTSYKVYRYDEKAGKYTPYKNVSKNYLKLSGIQGSVKSFKVSAVFSDEGKTIGSELSTGVYAFVKPKSPKLTVKTEGRKATLKWKTVKGATSYEIFMKDGKSYSKIATVTSNKLSFEKKNIKPNVNVYFKVRAVTQKPTTVSRSAYSNELKVKVK